MRQAQLTDCLDICHPIRFTDTIAFKTDRMQHRFIKNSCYGNTLFTIDTSTYLRFL